MPNNPTLQRYFIDSEKVFLAQYDRSKGQNSSTNLGANREYFHNSFLEKILPRKLRVTNGEIWDSQGNKTGQLDTLLVRDDVASLEFGSHNTYFIEGVYAAIEVKSNLTRAKMSEAIHRLSPIQNLVDHKEGLAILGRENGETLTHPLRCIFAYEGATWRSLIKEIDKNNAWETLDLICVLNKGVLIRNGIYFKWDDKNIKFSLLTGEGTSLGILYLILTHFVSDYIARTVSLRPYFEPYANWSGKETWTTIIKESGD